MELLADALHHSVRTVLILGYAGIFGFLALENSVFPFLPSEVFLIIVGALASLNRFDPVIATLVATLGALTGYLIVYEAGRRLPDDRLLHWGRWIFLDEPSLERARTWFAARRSHAVLWGRLLPGLRHLVSLPAGSARMHRGRYLLLSGASTLVWYGVFVALGYLLARSLDTVTRHLATVERIGWVLLGATVLYVGYGFIRRRRR